MKFPSHCQVFVRVPRCVGELALHGGQGQGGDLEDVLLGWPSAASILWVLAPQLAWVNFSTSVPWWRQHCSEFALNTAICLSLAGITHPDISLYIYWALSVSKVQRVVPGWIAAAVALRAKAPFDLLKRKNRCEYYIHNPLQKVFCEASLATHCPEITWD